jgi:undecaprenyl diphosphate synthase
VAALRRIIECAPDLGIAVLTVYAFSADNWRRPAPEVAGLMSILETYLRDEMADLAKAGVRLSAIGRRDRLPGCLPDLVSHAETVSAAGSKLHVRVAIDYSARDAILAAAAACGPSALTREALSRQLAGAGVPDVDLLIRTGGEKRLSDFMLWEAAYAELYFTDRLWPDFGPDDLRQALREFRGRDRRFGALSSVAASNGASAADTGVAETARTWRRN